MSETSQTVQGPSSGLFSALKAFWRLPSLTIARFTLVSYIRSGRIYVDILCVVLFYVALFLGFGGNVSYFYNISGFGLLAITILGTALMAQREMSARIYLPFARLGSRAAYVRGLMLATGALRIPLFLLLLLLVMLYSGNGSHFCTPVCIEGATWSNMLPGAIGVLANCMVVSTLTVTFSLSIGTKRSLVVLLVWVAAVLYSNTGRSAVATFLSFTRIPLIPLGTVYSFGLDGTIGWGGLLAILVEVLYVLGLAWLAQYWLSRRDLLLQ